MDPRTMYLAKLRDIFKKEQFWSKSYIARAVGIPVQTMFLVLKGERKDEVIADRTMMKIKEFVDKYEKEHVNEKKHI